MVKKKYSEYISTINKIEDLFLTKDGDKVIQNIDDEKDSHQLFEKKIFGYIVSVLNNQRTLLVRNRALFLAINLGILGLLTKIIYEYSINEYSNNIEFSTGIYVVVLSLMGFGCGVFWKATTHYRRHKAWFLESLLVCLEQGYILNSKACGPITIIHFIDDKDKIRILKNPDSISYIVGNCKAKKRFTYLRRGFNLVYTLVLLCVFVYCSGILN